MGGVPLNENPIPGFPFSAVHVQYEAKLALVLNAVDPRIGGVLLRGEKGSAKSTLARGLAALLDRAAPFVELPVGATEDRVVGTLDLEAALTEGRRRLHPGLLAAADGGVLYVDEVNLLPDHLVDVLLDVAASGVNRVEREGMAASHPARFVLVGSMNPEEGELRPQLLDRFGLSVDVAAPRDPLARAEAVRRRLDFDADAGEVARRFAPAQRELAERLAAARPAAPGHELIASVTRLCAEVGAEGLRADLVICRAAAALAAWEGRGAPDLDDVRKVAPLALAHRRRRSPFEAPGIDDDEIDEALHAAQRGRSPGGPGPGLPQEDPGENRSPGGPGPGVERREQDGPEGGVPGEQDGPEGGGDPAPPGPTSRVVRLDATDRRPPGEAASGRRSLTQGRRGRLVGDRIPDGRVGDVAVGATVRAAAGRRALAGGAGPEALVSAADLREARREQRSANLLVLTVDASASMGVEQRMEAVKGAAISILLDA